MKTQAVDFKTSNYGRELCTGEIAQQAMYRLLDETAASRGWGHEELQTMHSFVRHAVLLVWGQGCPWDFAELAPKVSRLAYADYLAEQGE